MAKKKYYAVRKGRTTGIFEDWQQCQQQVNGFPGAVHKSFNSRHEAEAFLNKDSPARAATATSATAAARNSPPLDAARAKWYAVASGHETGLFNKSWDEVQDLVLGYSGSLFKSFKTEDEAVAWLNAQTQQSPSTGSESATSDAGVASNATSSCLAADQQQLQAAAMQTLQQQQQQQQQHHGPSNLLLDIYFNGCFRKHSGRAGYGYAVFDKQTNEMIQLGCGPLAAGSTNGEAEYTGMIKGMQAALTMQAQQGLKASCHVVAYCGSQWVVKQLQGECTAKGESLLQLYRGAKELEAQFASFELQHVDRDEIQLAARLSDLAMDLDAAVDQVVLDWANGVTRAELASLIADAADCNTPQVMQELCMADSFMLAVADIVSRIWDMPAEQVLALLSERGWDADTGGPPGGQLLQGRGSGVVAAAAAGGRGNDMIRQAAAAAGGDAAAGAMESRDLSRGMQSSPVVSAVSFRRECKQDIRYQGDRQQQQQQCCISAVAQGGANAGDAVAAAAAAAQQRLHNTRPLLVASLCGGLQSLQQQQQQQQQRWMQQGQQQDFFNRSAIQQRGHVRVSAECWSQHHTQQGRTTRLRARCMQQQQQQQQSARVLVQQQQQQHHVMQQRLLSLAGCSKNSSGTARARAAGVLLSAAAAPERMLKAGRGGAAVARLHGLLKV